MTSKGTLVKKDANQDIKKYHKDKNLRYEYKVNTNVLVGKLKDTLIEMIVAKLWRHSKILKEIQDASVKNLIFIRTYIKFNRKENKSPQMENKINKKRVL